jgi:hypothetical protein
LPQSGCATLFPEPSIVLYSSAEARLNPGEPAIRRINKITEIAFFNDKN